jgi:EmrB/QacA subfamily drug resistance transporter
VSRSRDQIGCRPHSDDSGRASGPLGSGRGGIQATRSRVAVAQPRSLVRAQRNVLLIAPVAAFMSLLDVTVVNVAFPAIKQSFSDAPIQDLSWILNAYNIVFAALLLPAGRLADLVGRRRTFLMGVAVFTAASAMCGLAPSPELLVGARILQAIGGAMLVPTSLALLLPEFPASKRGLVVGAWGAGAALAAAAGPIIGGLVVDVFEWRWVFFINVPIGLLVGLAGRRWLRESRDPSSGAVPDLVGISLLAAAMAALALGIVKGPTWGWSDARVLLSLCCAAALAPMFVRRSLGRRLPAFELSLFRAPLVAPANAGMFFYALAFYAALLASVLFLIGVWHYSALKAGAALTPAAGLVALSSGVAGRIADRYGARAVALPGTLLIAFAYAWWATSLEDGPSYLGSYLPGAVVWGIGAGATSAAFSTAAVAAVPSARFGTGSALNITARQLGGVVGISILVGVVGDPAGVTGRTSESFVDAWYVCAAAALAAALSSTGIRRLGERPRAANAEASRAQVGDGDDRASPGHHAPRRRTGDVPGSG